MLGSYDRPTIRPTDKLTDQRDQKMVMRGHHHFQKLSYRYIIDITYKLPISLEIFHDSIPHISEA